MAAGSRKEPPPSELLLEAQGGPGALVSYRGGDLISYGGLLSLMGGLTPPPSSPPIF